MSDDDICPGTDSTSTHCDHYYDPADRSCCFCGAVNWSIEDEDDIGDDIDWSDDE